MTSRALRPLLLVLALWAMQEAPAPGGPEPGGPRVCAGDARPRAWRGPAALLPAAENAERPGGGVLPAPRA
ncbi:MAG TPA: hypothetical protein VK849_05290, partial [Longimicrobiales bacterium]|nr:hypothetical protein [Longimicrobiales bacterium]